jgi:hypothetical protein
VVVLHSLAEAEVVLVLLVTLPHNLEAIQMAELEPLVIILAHL